MGKNNQERRRVKQKARKQAAAAHSGGAAFAGSAFAGSSFAGSSFGGAGSMGWSPEAPSLADQVTEALSEALHLKAHGDQVGFARAVSRLAQEGWRRTVERTLTSGLTRSVANAWRWGWQPADLVRLVGRDLGAAHLPLVQAVVAAELSGYAETTIEPRWLAQLSALQVQVWWPADRTVLAALAEQRDQDWSELVAAAVELVELLAGLPQLEVLDPLPGSATKATARAASTVDERILARVRALLAKAESTTFEAEAETFTAGAQALMARHSIDHALLAAAGRGPSEAPSGRRLGIDNPYESPKASLLDAVASANRCRAVWSKQLGFATVVGFTGDLDAVELLFTSLLVQATRSVTQAGTRTDAYGRSRTRRFRQSFLLAYAHRIGERLTEATATQTDQAAAETTGRDLLPVLAARHEAVDETLSLLFPRLITHEVATAWDGEGWASGRAAADLATIGADGGGNRLNRA